MGIAVRSDDYQKYRRQVRPPGKGRRQLVSDLDLEPLNRLEGVRAEIQKYGAHAPQLTEIQAPERTQQHQETRYCHPQKRNEWRNSVAKRSRAQEQEHRPGTCQVGGQ